MKRISILITALFLLTAAVPVHAAEAIKIGLMGPMTGPWASEGQEMKQVIELLAAEVNAKAGLLGKKVEILSEDDAGDPKSASLAAQRLVTRGVIAV
ncbi:MAG: ABC transporter substrate-binding protein, partial [Syntrophales bacterium]|nr:ABC transporter substrate-binding protein [Syntrophales bacterium]